MLLLGEVMCYISHLLRSLFQEQLFLISSGDYLPHFPLILTTAPAVGAYIS